MADRTVVVARGRLTDAGDPELVEALFDGGEAARAAELGDRPFQPDLHVELGRRFAHGVERGEQDVLTPCALFKVGADEALHRLGVDRTRHRVDARADAFV